MTKNIWTLTSVEELKPVALEINKSENRRTKNFNWTFLQFQLINISI